MPEPFFHVGMLVDDLEQAIEVKSRVLGTTFTDVAVAHVDRLVDEEGERSVDIRVAYSREGPPYLELIENHPNGMYGRQHGEGLHHVGYWESDPERCVARWRAEGLDVEAIQYTPDGQIIVAYLAPRDAAGTRIEIVNEARRQMMETWIAGGAWVD